MLNLEELYAKSLKSFTAILGENVCRKNTPINLVAKTKIPLPGANLFSWASAD
jgi:hypothetical protein